MQSVEGKEFQPWKVRLVERTELEDTLNELSESGYDIYSIETVEGYPEDLKEVIACIPIEYVSGNDDDNGNGNNE